MTYAWFQLYFLAYPKSILIFNLNLYFTPQNMKPHIEEMSQTFAIMNYLCLNLQKQKKASRKISYFVGRFLIVSHLENLAYIIEFPQNSWFLLLNILTYPQKMQSFWRNISLQRQDIDDISQILLKSTEKIKHNYKISWGWAEPSSANDWVGIVTG